MVFMASSKLMVKVSAPWIPGLKSKAASSLPCPSKAPLHSVIGWLQCESEVSPMTAAHDNRKPVVIAHARLLYMASVSVGYVNRKVSASSQQFQALGCIKYFDRIISCKHNMSGTIKSRVEQGNQEDSTHNSLSTHTHHYRWWQHSSHNLSPRYCAFS